MTGTSTLVRYLWSVYRRFKVSGVWHEDNGSAGQTQEYID
jgi:hypothetical protein